MQPHRLAILVVAAMVGACAEPPFIETKAANIVAKPDDEMRLTGRFAVCHGEQDYAEAERIARQRCASYGFQSEMVSSERYQCRASAPHRVVFRCLHPEMTDSRGQYINPFDVAAIEEWRKRTGKTPPAPPVPGWSTGDAPIVPGQPSPMVQRPEVQGAPPPAVLGPAAPGPIPPALGSADITGWPVPEVTPPAPLPPELEQAPGAFDLPMGSWGQAFEER